MIRPQIDIWIACTEESGTTSQCDAYRGLLSPAERQRELRFHFQHDRHCFLVSRALLRTALTNRCPAVKPAAWEFETDAYGRPHVRHPDARVQSIAFSLSHSDGVIALAIAEDFSIGIDVEAIRNDVPILELADRYFSPVEAAALKALAPDQELRRFFEYWTLKESYIKARGLGLSIPLDRFWFEIASDNSLGFQAHVSLERDPSAWKFTQWLLPSGSVMALCHRQAPEPEFTWTCRHAVPLDGVQECCCQVLRASS